jgi:hypothetical protein
VPVIRYFLFFSLNLGTALKNQFQSGKSREQKSKKKQKGKLFRIIASFAAFCLFGFHPAFRSGAVEIKLTFCNSAGKFASFRCVL